MDHFKKVVLSVFCFLSLLSLLVNFLHYQGKISLVLIIHAIVFNILIALIIVEITNFFYIITKKKYVFLLFYFLVFIIALWYITGEWLSNSYGFFLTFSGIIFFFYTPNTTQKIFWGLGILFFVIVIPYIIYRYKGKITKKVQVKSKYLLVLVILILAILLFTPKIILRSSSPFTEAAYPLITEREYLSYNNVTLESNNSEKVLNLSINLNKPNIIILMLESVPAERVHYYGYNRTTTPNIDNLAKESIVFSKAFSSASHSDLAQTAFLSSRYALSSKLKEIPLYNGYSADFIWDTLKKQGYNTSYFSSQDDNFLRIIDFINKTNLDIYSPSLSDGISDYSAYGSSKDFDQTTVDKAINWIDNNKDNHFFLYLDLQSTHISYTYSNNSRLFTPDELPFSSTFLTQNLKTLEILNNRFDNALYEVDTQVGRIIRFLNESNLLNNTIIILTSDHGEDLNESHGYFGHGMGVYNPEVNIPLIFYIPQINHSIITENVKHIDVVPTILSLLKFNLSEKLQGTEMYKNTNIFLIAQNLNEVIGVIKDNVKYIINLQTYELEAYNLTQDPKEYNNLIDSNNSLFYKERYNPILLDWFNCQVNYYQEANFSKKINC